MQGNYKTPRHLTLEARELLRGILCTDPNARFSIDQIRNHIWFALARSPNPKGIITKIHKIPIDEEIFDATVKLNVDKDLLRNSLINNKHNSATATY
jgi:5'-AMP-activated protein kinase catalytic alpha subunit